MPFVEILDPLNKTLIKAARNRLSPPTQEYDEYLKEKQREKYNIDLLLGKKEKIPRTFGKDEALEQALKKEKTKREAKEVADQVKTDFHLAKSQKRKNHDSILISEKRFKQINRKNLEKKRQQTKIK